MLKNYEDEIDKVVDEVDYIYKLSLAQEFALREYLKKLFNNIQ